MHTLRLFVSLFVGPADAQEVRSLRVDYHDAMVRSAPDDRSKGIGTLGAGVRLPLRGDLPGPGCDEPWFRVAPAGFVCGQFVRESREEPHLPDLVAVPSGKVLPYRYGFARREGARVFVRAGDLETGAPERVLEKGFGIGLRWARRVGDDLVWRTRGGRYVLDSELRMANPIEFDGLRIPKGERPQAGWTYARTTPIVPAPGDSRWERIAELDPRTPVVVLEARTFEDVSWLRVSFAGWRRFRRDAPVSEGWVEAEDVRRVTYAARPPEVREKERWIDVDRASQTLVAYDGGVPIFATMVSTGRSRHPTPRGLNRIHSKHASARMDDEDPVGDDRPYALEDVPWVQYFSGGVGLHAAFWHAAFGYRVSHGCVNLAPNDARFLYAWTALPVPPGWTARFATENEPGTVVRVR